MADHNLKSLELLDELDDLERELLIEYASAARSHVIADLHGRIGRTMKRADVHANLAIRQELERLASLIDRRGVEVTF